MVLNVIFQEIGGNALTGIIYAFDGERANRLEGLTGAVRGVMPIDDGSEEGAFFVCTSEGHGIFDGQAGWASYWRKGACPLRIFGPI